MLARMISPLEPRRLYSAEGLDTSGDEKPEGTVELMVCTMLPTGSNGGSEGGTGEGTGDSDAEDELVRDEAAGENSGVITDDMVKRTNSEEVTLDDPSVIFQTFGASRAIPTTPGVTLVKGRLLVVGNATADTVAFAAEGNNIAVTFNGTKTTYAASAVKKIELFGQAGNDTVTMNLTAGLVSRTAISLSGGEGNDTLTTNVRARLFGDNGNDSLTGSAAKDVLSGGAGDDTIVSGGSTDSISGGLGSNTVTYANGDQDVGVLKLRTKNNVLTITGSNKAETITFAQGTGTNVTVTVGGKTATFNLANKTGVVLNGGSGRDTAVVPTGLFGTKPFSKKSIEVG